VHDGDEGRVDISGYPCRVVDDEGLQMWGEVSALEDVVMPTNEGALRENELGMNTSNM
jgi:hypothetical protein